MDFATMPTAEFSAHPVSKNRAFCDKSEEKIVWARVMSWVCVLSDLNSRPLGFGRMNALVLVALRLPRCNYMAMCNPPGSSHIINLI